MPQAIGVFVADAFAFNVAGATVAAAAAIEVGVTLLATVAVNQAIGALLKPNSSGQGGTAGTQVLSTTIRQSDAARRLIYGTVKAGGVMLYPQQDPSGQYIRVCIYLGEGPIQGVSSVMWLGDELSSEAKFTGLVELESRLGLPGQTAFATLVSSSAGEWLATDVAAGCALALVTLKASREAFPRGRVNLPFAFLIDGRLCYDPRTQATAFTRNPALCRLDHMRSEFGPDGGIPDDQIDFPSFAAAANVCDEIIDSIDPGNIVNGVPGKVRRYTIDAVFEVSAGHTQIAETIDTAMAGKVVFVNGKYRCYAGAWRAPTGPTLNAEYLRAPLTFRTHQIRTERFNIMRGKYREPRQDWQSTDFHEQTLPAAVIAEDGEIIQTIEYPVTTSGAIAQRLAKLAMMQARSAVPLVVQCNWAAIQWQLYDVIPVDLPQVGAAGAWLINGYSIDVGGGVNMTLLPHLASDYAWNPLIDEKVVQFVVAPSFNSEAQAVQGLLVVSSDIYVSNDNLAYGLKASWTQTDDAYWLSYELQYKLTSSSEWVSQPPINANQWESQLSTGLAYDVRVRIVRRDQTFGPWVEQLNTLVNGDNTPPGLPTALSVTGTSTHTITWRNPIDLDVMRARVYASLTNSAATGVQIAELFGLPDTVYQAIHTPAAVPIYYWVSVIDRAGNLSARESAGVGN